MKQIKLTVICASLIFLIQAGYVHADRTLYVTVDEGNGYRLFSGNNIKNTSVTEASIQGYYMIAINESGWDFLEIKADPSVPDIEKAYWAGYLEARLMPENIYNHWFNSLHNFCENRVELCHRVQNYLDTNQKWIDSMVANYSDTNSYWYQVRLFYIQLLGLSAGYAAAAEDQGNSYRHLTFNDFLWLNIQGDLEDLLDALNTDSDEEYVPFSVRGSRVPGSQSCSALIKLLDDSSDLYTSHDTWSSFQSMLRVQKKYILPYNILPNATETVPGSVMTFSSYPGVIQSGDDFYITSAGLTILETTNGNNNRSLWQYVHPEGQVLEQVRTMVANRLGKSGKSWCDVFSEHNSGTYNNQWMVVDYKLFKVGTPQRQLKNHLLWVLEQLPGHITAADKTDVLRQQSYWPSYNTPYFPDIYNLSGQPELAAQYGDWFTYERNPRALMFKRDHVKVNGTDSMIALMRYNDYKHDPLSRCNCTPPYSGENTIACRNDVNPSNGTYPFPALGHRSHTATDMKLTTSSLAPTLQFMAISGPPHNDYMPPFQWSTSDYKDLPHLGHPDYWNFGVDLHEWYWN